MDASMPYKIAISGAGLAGLAAASFLKQQGHDVTVFERFAEPKPVGAGLLLQPSGLAVLAELGLDQAMIGKGGKIANLHGKTHKGKNIFDIHYQDLAPSYFGVGIHRATLFNALFDKAKSDGATFVNNCHIQSSALQNDQRTLNCANNITHGPFDLVIDASGYKSTLRQYGETVLSKPYPYGALWGVCKNPNNLLGGRTLDQRYKSAHIMIGILPIGKKPDCDDNHVAFFWSIPAHKYQDWKDQGLEAWKQDVLNIWPEIKPFVDQFQQQSDLTFASYGDIVMKQWHGDKIAFIGDAAHCSSPQLGQGANMGFIDALTLAKALAEKPTIDAALAHYSTARKNHIRFYQRASRWLTPFFQSSCQHTGTLRDLTFGPMCKVPYLKREMLRALAGLKTGFFSQLDPGAWNKAYKIKQERK